METVSAKRRIGELIHCGQEALAVRESLDRLKEMNHTIENLKRKVAVLEHELKVAEQENDRLLTESLQVKESAKKEHRELWDRIHAILMEYSPGRKSFP